MSIFETKELDENSVISKMETTTVVGKEYDPAVYNFDTIISVGNKTILAKTRKPKTGYQT